MELSPLGPVSALSDLETGARTGQYKPRTRLNRASNVGKVDQVIMKRHQILGLAFLALFAFSAILAASASAEVTLLAEWLVNGATIATLASKTTGEILLEDSKVLGVKVDILCSAILDGTILANGESEITEVLSLTGVLITKTPLTGETLSCENKENCGGTGALASVYPLNLPWVDLLYLRENGQIWDDVTSKAAEKAAAGPGYEVECTILGTKITDECTTPAGLTEFQIINNTAAEANGPSAPNGNCTAGGAGAGINEAFDAPITVETGTLTVSSE
jgi:hypothetical protein